MEFELKKKKNPKKNIFFLSLTLIMFLGISLAAYLVYHFQDSRENMLSTGLISIDFQENSEVIKLENTVPVLDEVGLLNTSYEFTVKNTSKIPINLKIQLEVLTETTIPLGAIRYAFYIDDELKTIDNIKLNDDGSLYIHNNFPSNKNVSCKIIFWVDYYYENPGETFSAKIKVTGESFDIIYEPLYDKFKKVLDKRENTYTLEDDIIYVAGYADDNNLDTTSDVDYNYVWYSGKLWRITNLYSDGTMKLVTENLFTSISNATSSLDSNGNSIYPNSYIREWLEQEFLPTLYNYQTILKTNYLWNATRSSSSTSKLGTTTLVESPIGLLNSYEYYKTFEKIGTSASAKNASYLNIGYWWWLMNTYNENYIFSVHSDGAMYAHSSSDKIGIRPAIVFKDNVEYLSGNGTKENPYKIKNDIQTLNLNKLNERVAGEYVKLENDNGNRIFRIVDKEVINGNLSTKLVLDDYLKENGTIITKKFSTSYQYGTGTDNTYWDYYLNNDYLSTLDVNLLEEGTYYIGTYSSGNYKKVICSTVDNSNSIKKCIENATTTSNTWKGYVGLLRIGEIFSSSNSNYKEGTAKIEWYITPNTTTAVHVMDDYAGLDSSAITENKYAVRPTINLKYNVVIKSGSGTKDNPFIVGLN